MTDATIDAHELTNFGADLGRISSESTRSMIGVFREAGDDLVTKWTDLARVSSGVHGKRYPDSIDAEMRLSTNIVIEVGPNPAKPQGGMAFETGSVNQPPHPDGARATDIVLPELDRHIQAALTALGL